MKQEYSGLLSLHEYGEALDVLFLSSLSAPLADELSFIAGKNVSVRYWVTDRPCAKEEAMESALISMFGVADACFGARYSEITGYLWTDEELNVGGHSLIERLKSDVGKWLHLEIEVH